MRWEVSGGQQGSEEWKSSNTDIADITLTGGEEKIWSTTPMFQTAVVTAKTPGAAIISVRQNHSLIQLYDYCTIIAFIQGDVDGDDIVSVTDALTVLQAANGKIELSDRAYHAADMDNSEDVSAADALAVLQKATGRIK